ncbi:hypothetical protein H4R21_003566, partial [Coemansia helicoidea]
MNRNANDKRGVPPLKELCQRAIVANIGLPQFLVADALAQCTAEQLEAIEQHNPHIVADNEPLWMAHCGTKYKELRELQREIANGAAPPVPSWRAAYWAMRRQDEIRAQQIRERIRSRAAEFELERNARKVRVIPPSAARARPRTAAAAAAARHGAARGTSLVQQARVMTKAHLQMFQPAQSPARAHSPPPPLAAAASASAARSKHQSPAVSPAQSPPYNPSPPYYSSASASSCSPPHLGYSPPYVPHS